MSNPLGRLSMEREIEEMVQERVWDVLQELNWLFNEFVSTEGEEPDLSINGPIIGDIGGPFWNWMNNRTGPVTGPLDSPFNSLLRFISGDFDNG